MEQLSEFSLKLRDKTFKFDWKCSPDGLLDCIEEDEYGQLLITIPEMDEYWDSRVRVMLSVRSIATFLFQSIVDRPKRMCAALQCRRGKLTKALYEGVIGILDQDPTWGNAWLDNDFDCDLHLSLSQINYANVSQYCTILPFGKIRWRITQKGVQIEERTIRELYPDFEDFRKSYYEEEDHGTDADDQLLWAEELEEAPWPIIYGVAAIEISFEALLAIVQAACEKNISFDDLKSRQRWADLVVVLISVLARVPGDGKLGASAELRKLLTPVILRPALAGWPRLVKDRTAFKSKLPKAYQGLPLSL